MEFFVVTGKSQYMLPFYLRRKGTFLDV